jgi:DNA repair exonuclease SbcCD nuclease subunit
MSNLFKRAAVFTDLHYGAKANSDLHNNDCLNFIKWFIETAKKHQCDTCIFLGDYHNNRNTMNLKTMNFAIHGLELLSQNFDQTFFIPGNHDLFFKDNRRIYSTPWAKHMPNITIVNDWVDQGDVIIAPWLVGDDYKKVKKLSGKYIFGHFELPGFFMNSQVKMPDHGDISSDHFGSIEHCYSGHFHKRQTNKNITYIGNAFPHNYSDAGDDERGMMILEWGNDPVFLSWPDQPTFRTMKLSELLDESCVILKNQYIRASVDIELSFEESAVIKEQFIADHGIRELVLVPERLTFDITEEETFEIEPIDKTIVTQITRIDSDTYDKTLLLDIYNNL